MCEKSNSTNAGQAQAGNQEPVNNPGLIEECISSQMEAFTLSLQNLFQTIEECQNADQRWIKTQAAVSALSQYVARVRLPELPAEPRFVSAVCEGILAIAESEDAGKRRELAAGMVGIIRKFSA